jgi:N-acetylglutamate synthase-like GNAT family acetyltransferase
MDFFIEGPLEKQAQICEPILRNLPEWFGIESAIAQYITDIDMLPTFLARSTGDVLGFLTLRQHNRYAAEIHVMGVHPSVHRQGTGKALVETAQSWLRQQQVEYLQVKTLGPSHPDMNYAMTRAFYLQMGFRPLEELKQIWDEYNPCLILVKKL